MLFVPRYQSCVSFNVVRNHGTPIPSIFEGSLACASLFDSAQNDVIPPERLRILRLRIEMMLKPLSNGDSAS